MAAKRRANGDGSFRQNKDGSWEVWGTLADGRRVHRRAPTRAEAQRRLRQAQDAAQRGLPVPDERLTVKSYLLDMWLKELVGGGTRPRTMQGYEAHVRLHLIPCLGQIKLAQLSAADVQRLVSTLREKGLAPRTIQRVRDTLRNALSRAEAQDLVARNVAKRARLPKVEDAQRRAIDVPDAEAILDAVAGHRLAPLFEFALYTGLRLGELAGLRWSDVDLDGGTLQLGEQLQRLPNKGFVRARLKNSRSARTMALPPVATAVLRRRRALQAQERLLAGGSWSNDDGLVFSTPTGTPLGHGVTRVLQRLVFEAGLPPCTMHDLRRACATILLARGEQPHVVQQQLGHSDVRLTLGVYAKVTTAMSAKAAATMDEAFRGRESRRSAS